MKRRKNPFPGVSTVEDRRGKFRHRLRRTIRGRTIDTYLPGPYGSPAFRAAYEEVVEGTRVATRRARPGTVGYLVATYLVSAAFRNLAPATRAAKRGRLDWIREAIGQARYAALQPRHVGEEGRDRKRRTASRRTWGSYSALPRSATASRARTPPRSLIPTR